jgi:hypothetical protein
MLPTLLHDPGFSLTVSQQGIHTRGYSSPGLSGSPRPQRGGLQSPTRTVTLVDQPQIPKDAKTEVGRNMSRRAFYGICTGPLENE